MAKKRSFLRRLFWRAVKVLLGLACASVIAVGCLRWVAPATSAFMLGSYVSALSKGEHDYRARYRWKDWRMISDHVKLAVIAAEDQRFPDHRGFDFEAIGNALDDYFDGKPLRGASTISQQVAKNLFLWPGRSLLRKALEVHFTLLLEVLLPKRRILEIYLNIAEFGPGIYGADAAAEAYFGKSAAALTRGDSALLAAVLPNPSLFRVDGPSAYVKRRRLWILDQMRRLGGARYLRRIPAA